MDRGLLFSAVIVTASVAVLATPLLVLISVLIVIIVTIAVEVDSGGVLSLSPLLSPPSSWSSASPAAAVCEVVVWTLLGQQTCGWSLQKGLIIRMHHGIFFCC